jgi:hypothetical protein
VRILDCFVADAPRNDGWTCHCERSEAIQAAVPFLDCFVADAPRNDGTALRAVIADAAPGSLRSLPSTAHGGRMTPVWLVMRP